MVYGGPAGSAIASQIKVPEGSQAIDVYVLTAKNTTLFMNKEDAKFKYHRDISILNAKEAVQYIDTGKYGNSFYIGLRNPSALSGINIKIEVVAVVDEAKIDTKKAILYGNMGWKAYENKDYKKALFYNKKAVTFDPNLSFVKFNIGLLYLVQGKEEAEESYLEAIATCKKDQDPIGSLKTALEDIRELKATNPNLKSLSEIEYLLVNEIGEK
ncbi:tetratricopeptide repeat protein [Flavobacterium phycosphaerae]|uniref:tetratricopeptide repeat protein n=1 Tax=Flavobacterium phycosphaerae TaxID=2697515 RepID=UPI001389DF97|nr:hypothetical protein [Flavobacterium phycosphaerae]